MAAEMAERKGMTETWEPLRCVTFSALPGQEEGSPWVIWDVVMERTLILDEAEMSVEWESQGGQNWPGLQKEFPHNRDNLKENVKNLRRRLAWAHTNL